MLNTERQDYKKLILFLYVLTPFLFYGAPLLLVQDDGRLTLHFFKTFVVESAELRIIFGGHVVLGLAVFWALGSTNYKIQRRLPPSLLGDILAVLALLAYFNISIGHIKVFIFPIFLLVISYRRPGALAFLGFVLVALVQLIFRYDRYPIIMVSLIYFMPLLASFSFKRLMVSAVVAVLLLMYVLQPLRSGQMPFSNQASLHGVEYFFIHLNPIYIAAHLSYDMNFSIQKLLSETLPLAKSLLGVRSVIEDLARVGLPRDIIEGGTRHGSNSAMFFHLKGAIVLFFSVLLIRLAAQYINLSLFRNALLINLIVQGPYFIRRSFGSFVVDFIVLLIVSLVVAYLLQCLHSNEGD